MSDMVHKNNELPKGGSSLSKNGARRPNRGFFGIPDFFIVLLCLSVAAGSLILFRNDLFETINSRNDSVSIGSIYIKDNNVQRRLTDRVLWGRLAIESPVYPGDLVRVAELSSATMDIQGNHIDLGENTLIRIQPPTDGKGPINIELSQGTMDLSTSSGKGIILNIMGKQVQVAPGTVLNASAGESGMVIQVSEGNATVIETEDEHRELAAGTLVAMDTGGQEKTEPAVVVRQPRPVARYLKTGPDALNVTFNWNRVNLDDGVALRLEIAADRNFNTIGTVINNLNDTAQANLDAGNWYWRISGDDTVLSSGQITVLDASAPALISPARDQLFRYQTDLPRLRFQWAEIPEAANYMLQVSMTADFANPEIERETSSTSYIDSNLGPGTWYWRVAPIFPPIYEGSAPYSAAASFSIEKSNETVVLKWPEPVQVETPPPEILPEPETPTETPKETPVPVIPAKAVPVTPPVTPKTQAPAAVQPAPQVTPKPAPIQLLPEPANRLPAAGYTIGIDELKVKRSIDFSWSPVPGANAYIFTLYQQTQNGKQEVTSSTIENRTGWTLANISMLDRGTFIWQVVAVNMNSDGTIREQGIPGENTFTLDIPIPGQPSIQVEEAGSADDD